MIVGAAALAERAVVHRHLRRVWGVPGTRLGVVGHPAGAGERLFLRWHYWWQAHLLDCVVDAQHRLPTTGRADTITAIVDGHRLRNLGLRGNRYYDDMAWWALAMLRADPLVHRDLTPSVDLLARRIKEAWNVDHGGIPWRKRDTFLNVPASGPAAILLARRGFLHRATEITDWIERLLLRGDDHLVGDGLHPDPGHPGGYDIGAKVYTYNQGVVLGAELELIRRTDADPARLHRLVAAIATHLTTDDAPGRVLVGEGGGNGGLFTGILVRHLTRVALDLPGTSSAEKRTRDTATRLVLHSADAAWSHRAEIDGLPVFGADWSVPAQVPRPGGAGRVQGNARVEASRQPERDLSVQLAGWMLMEAAESLQCSSPRPLTAS